VERYCATFQHTLQTIVADDDQEWEERLCGKVTIRTLCEAKRESHDDRCCKRADKQQQGAEEEVPLKLALSKDGPGDDDTIDVCEESGSLADDLPGRGVEFSDARTNK
jgi:hypothetical protein